MYQRKKNMKIQDLNKLGIKNNDDINSKFLSTDLEKLSVNCKIYKGDFYLDTFNYILISPSGIDCVTSTDFNYLYCIALLIFFCDE
mgnify:CR=1 FL=1